ncbi:slit homolog 2 protein-like [Stegodyphus dumicola]|uniref:slit homolog 2 protein-like n=1 Tax=Stegodyphus dumicola TaxID=202533 RepID=UPI0015B0C321|nr:slit homolog 2 protein-like [Stegodyphus dumicola]
MLQKIHYWCIYLTVICYIIRSSDANLIEECPPPEDNYPCYCEEEEEMVVHCNYLNESKQIQNAFNKLSGYKIFKVSFWKNEIDVIKSDMFRGLSIKQVVFTNSSVRLESPQFVGLESSLNRLTFLSSFDKDTPMETWSVEHLEILKEMRFDRNEIKILKNSWLSSSGPVLRSLTFSECQIEKLEDKVFSKMDSLTTLFLTDNEITAVSRSMFPRPAENLRSIDLNGNKLQTLPDDIFKDMPSLKSIDLGRNLLKTVSESTWSFIVESFSRVILEDNPIKCDKSLKWISKKDLPKTFTGKCSAPAKLKNRPIRNLTPADFY